MRSNLQNIIHNLLILLAFASPLILSKNQPSNFIQNTQDDEEIHEIQSSQNNKLKITDEQCSLTNTILQNQLFSFSTDCPAVQITNVTMVFDVMPLSGDGKYKLSLVYDTIIINGLTIVITQISEVGNVNEEVFSVDFYIEFITLLTMANSKLPGMRYTIFESNVNYQLSQLILNNVSLSSQRILFLSGVTLIDTNSIIQSTEYFCKTTECNCKFAFNDTFPVYDSADAVYLSLLQDFNDTANEFNITASLLRYNKMDLFQLLEDNVISDNPMRVQFLIFSYTELRIYNESTVSASNIAIYAQTITVVNASSINTTGRGCASSSGLGCGIFDTTIGLYQCGGTGGSYGGQGGNALSLSYASDTSCSEIESRQLYGNPFNPIFEGSGGGSDDDIDLPIYMSSGGGVIYIECILQVTLLDKSTIEANGTGTEDSEFNNGGGSGGSIQIHTESLRGNSSVVMANGGMAFQSGGSGSGGRIKLNFTDWMNQTLWLNTHNDLNFTVQVNPGIGIVQPVGQNSDQNSSGQLSQVYYYNSTGEIGSIMTTPCPSQYELVNGYNCQVCPAGYQKPFSGWSNCTICRDKPPNSYYITSTKNVSLYFCSYKCNSGYSEEDDLCLDSSSLFVYKVGGWEVIIPVITFLLCLASLVLARLLDNRKRKRSISDFKIQQAIYNNNTSQNANMYDIQVFQLESQKRPDFHVEDLPYHMKRIYLHGENTHKKPWKLISQDDDFEMEELAMIFNEMTKYTKLQTRLLWIFKLIYIVSYFWASRYMKTIKLLSLKKLISEHEVIKKYYNQEEDAEQFKYKLTTSTDLSLAFIDIFNYNISVLNWQNKTNFPVCLVLAGKGSFISPFHVYSDDPLCKSLYFTFQQQDQMDMDEDYDQGIIRFENFLKEFNSIAKLIDYSTREKTFLDNFSKLVKYVDKQNKKFFQEYGIEADICIHKLVRDKYVKQQDSQNMFNYNERNLQSRIIMLSYKDQGELINCLKDTHYLKNYSRFYEIKISLNFYIINEIIHNDQVEIKTEHNINKQIQSYMNYDQQDEEVNHLRNKVMKKNYSESKERFEAFIPRYDHTYDDDYNQNESVIEERKCFWLILIFFYLRRIFGVFKSSFLRYRQTNLGSNVLGVLMLVTMIIHFVSVICTFISFFIDSNSDQSYRNTEMYIVFLVYPLCFAISPLIMIVWLVKHTERIGKVFMLFNYNAFYTYIIIGAFGLTDVIRNSSEAIHVLIGIAKIIGIITTWLMSYFGSGYILLQEFI